MYYTKFRIQNFKGIKDTTIKLSEQTKVGVFAFVGLNESGKTTILEAIHSFSPDMATSEVVGGKGNKTGVPFSARVPRHLISNFTGKVSVAATVKVAPEEKEIIITKIKNKHGLIINPETFHDEITFERYQIFKNGDFEKTYFRMLGEIELRTTRQKKWRKPNLEEKNLIKIEIYSKTPDIAYFPTFVFDFPKKIYLTEERGDKISNFFREVFQDILDYDGSGHSIDDSIVRRVRSQETKTTWLKFLEIWNSNDDRDKIQHVMDRAEATVTNVVFGRWNKIFGEDVKGKEINISYEVVEGEKQDKNGNLEKTNEHDIFIKFQIKDGTRRFDVNDRSLGFRWFFSFMLFTQFRVAREFTRPILFLFDEPASNLHAAAQQKLIESFPEIAKENHTLAYSTHSHYMIEPKWLEQTFIVTNRADSPNDSVIDGLSLSDESLDIRATRYRAFIGKHPHQTNYFQPIIDRLNVVPSRFDIERSSIIVEGKSDYYILRYAIELLNEKKLPLIPGLGAGTFGSLISLHIGWGLKMVILLDGDNKGVEVRNKYIKDYIISDSCVVTLSEIVPEACVIEDLLCQKSLEIIKFKLEISKKPNKDQIRRFFQESLAKNEIVDLGVNFKTRVEKIITSLSQKINA